MRSGSIVTARRTWVAPVLIAGIAVALDAANRLITYGIFSTGPVDEAAHVATAALGLLVVDSFVTAPRRFYVAALVASVAIDLDHLPSYLGMGSEVARPVTHSLATVVLVLVAAWLRPGNRAVLVGVAVGLTLHFTRDVTEGVPGVRMLWPLDQTAWTGSRVQFIAIVLVLMTARLALMALGRPRRRRQLFVGEQRP